MALCISFRSLVQRVDTANNMQLTPLGRCKSQARPQASAVAKATTPIPRPSQAATPAVSGAADSSCDIHRLLEFYSRQITKTEGEIDFICQQQQQVLQEHQNDLQALQEAKREAQAAHEESAALAAQVHQRQMEVSAKQANCSRIQEELTALAESCKVTHGAMRTDKHQFILQCQQLDADLRGMLAIRDKRKSG